MFLSGRQYFHFQLIVNFSVIIGKIPVGLFRELDKFFLINLEKKMS